MLMTSPRHSDGGRSTKECEDDYMDKRQLMTPERSYGIRASPLVSSTEGASIREESKGSSKAGGSDKGNSDAETGQFETDIEFKGVRPKARYMFKQAVLSLKSNNPDEAI